MRHRDADRSLPEIARELGADAVIEGSVLRAGERVRITLQLIDARSDRHLWSQSYERDLGNVLALQSEVARAVSREIAHELSPGARERLARRGPVDPLAYDAVLKGRHLLQSFTPANHKHSVRYFELALERDPDYAPAWAGLADAYT
jgi:hypothetical protein